MLFDIVDYYRSRTNSFYMLEGYLDRCGNRFKYVKVTGKGKSLHSNNLSATSYHKLQLSACYIVAIHINCELTPVEKSDQKRLEKLAN